MLLQKRQVRRFMRLTCRNFFCAFFKDPDTTHAVDPPRVGIRGDLGMGQKSENLAIAAAVLFGLQQAQLTQLTLEHFANRAARQRGQKVQC